MSRKYGWPARCGLTERAASTLDAAVTAETIMSASRTASAADEAQRTPIASAGALEPLALGFGKQNVPGGDALDAGLAQARGDRLAGFAKADETECRVCRPALSSRRIRCSIASPRLHRELIRRSVLQLARVRIAHLPLRNAPASVIVRTATHPQ